MLKFTINAVFSSVMGLLVHAIYSDLTLAAGVTVVAFLLMRLCFYDVDNAPDPKGIFRSDD